MYKGSKRTCRAIVLLIKPFVLCRSRCRRRRGLLKLPTVFPTSSRVTEWKNNTSKFYRKNSFSVFHWTASTSQRLYPLYTWTIWLKKNSILVFRTYFSIYMGEKGGNIEGGHNVELNLLRHWFRCKRSSRQIPFVNLQVYIIMFTDNLGR